ncbi:hypothetical protein BGZ47_002586 [Haplosporangium gracile]|nr:hypothetical protein BGZ47_002586 [Haplosporangium gracile]
MSEPMFPGYVAVDDFSPPSLNPSLTAKGTQDRMDPVMKYRVTPSLNAQQPPQLEQDPLSALANSFVTGSSSSSSSPLALSSLFVFLGAIHCPRFEVFRWINQPWNLDTSKREDHDATNQFLVDMIVGIDRLTDQEQTLVNGALSTPKELATGLWPQEEAAIEKLHRCQRQHHEVYDQLAKLTRLKHLDLGRDPLYPMIYRWSNRNAKMEQRLFTPTGTPRLDTLELSLASELNRLTPLKDLEVFALQCVNHRIGKNELDWMAENWPKVDLREGALIEQRLLALGRR